MSQQTWTVELVIQEAAKKPGWFVNPGSGEIWRRTGARPGTILDLECPICAAAGTHQGLDFRAASDQMAMSRALAIRIARAADNAYDHDRTLRQAMLSAFGLPVEDREATR